MFHDHLSIVYQLCHTLWSLYQCEVLSVGIISSYVFLNKPILFLRNILQSPTIPIQFKIFPAQFASKIPQNVNFFPPTLSEALHTWTILGFIPPNLAEKYIKFFCLSMKFPQVQGLKLLALSKKNEAKIFEKKIPPIVTFSTCVMRFLLFYVAKQTPWTFSVETWLTAYQQRSQACWKHILDQ